MANFLHLTNSITNAKICINVDTIVFIASERTYTKDDPNFVSGVYKIKVDEPASVWLSNGEVLAVKEAYAKIMGALK